MSTTVRAIPRILLPILALTLGAHVAQTQQIQFQPAEDSPILAHNPAGPAELAQFDFVAGDWDVTVTMLRAGNPPLVYQARWHNHWIANGYVMMQEWRGPFATGVELRSYNPGTRRWDGRNLYVPDPGTWYTNEAEQVGSDMIVTSHQTSPDGAPLVNREIYHATGPDRFQIRTEVSRDAGVSWTPGPYSIVATRARR